MSKITKTLAVAAATAIIGAGTYVGTNQSDSTEPATAEVSAVTIPEVDIPSVYVPIIATVDIDTPNVDITIDTPTVALPSATQIKIVDGSVVTPEAETIEVENKSVNTPETAEIVITIPCNMNFVAIDPDCLSTELGENIQDMIINESSVTVPGVNKITLQNPAERLPEVMSFYQKLKSLFKDQRNIDYDQSINYDNQAFKKWVSIYKVYKEISAPVFIPTKGLRMITEIKAPKTPADSDILAENLAYYKSRGYTSALLTFDGSENIADLVATADVIRDSGFNPWFAYGGKETLHSTVFIDPDKYAAYLTALAKKCDGFLMGWRRTSQHLFEHDVEWDNYTINSLRKSNPDIMFLGEVYYGNTATNPLEHKWGLSINIPANCSGVMINNFGFNGINIDGVVNKFIPSKINIKEIPKIGVVVGDRAYYLIKNSRNLSQEENQKIKEEIERKFIKSGCVGTITLHDDGSDRAKGITGSNDLSTAGYKEMTTKE